MPRDQRGHHRNRIAVIGISVISLWMVAYPVHADDIQLDVGTSTTISPLPPVPSVRQIDENSPPEATLDQPLSLMGEVLLDAVCSSWIPADFALKVFPDLSQIHIQRTCPQVTQG